MKLNRLNRRAAALAAVLIVAGVAAWEFAPSAPAQTAPQAKPAALTVTVVAPQTFDWPDTIEANGSTAAWQEAIISAETGSLRITELLVDVGSEVKRGQLLARLADATATADLRKQEAAVAQARANLQQAQADLKRSQQVADSGAVSAQKLDEYRITEAVDRAALASAEAELQNKRTTLSQTRIVAVDDGIVSSRSALLGNVVGAGTELFRLIRQGRVEWQAEVDAQQLARVRAGQAARVTLPGGKTIDGKVRLVSPTLSTNTGRAIAYVALNGRDAQPGMFASGTMELGARPALTLPESALVPRDGRTDVYVLNGDGATVSRRTVVAGRRRDGRCEIVSGLEAGARVVSTGGGFLSDGVTVKVLQANANGVRA
ncbi:efflux RND transporter periplasmic adaptor subunit [Ralstonia solanacearum]|uniref:efflux RND transporter periplasmic adaptor subunit n=1 Tax=Ralstonia solanacearum TaxID=305 RepID=UPI00078BE40D|nr:efflux RND transporter periplasmic adaptor subunit [Ralstonia solanacearum]AMP39615.1 efflux transporter periplasmic adaptor subunit [Ralstonia solanacearum]AXV88456.1 efflux RND transporter periplasmic adaptor subunit [Ralstonia solanacearum]AXW07931.1 efflux RND transporter periplasmic adaptor subunit [Ralstonia solanacearum]AXW25722.1 efflux RND transporter periplasmic adaptor subunit [Ralstonia solanacearum]AXW82632.1 efflux RND transporter periplasmic adaptor subunit [Ralstonia solanac